MTLDLFLTAFGALLFGAGISYVIVSYIFKLRQENKFNSYEREIELLKTQLSNSEEKENSLQKRLDNELKSFKLKELAAEKYFKEELSQIQHKLESKLENKEQDYFNELDKFRLLNQEVNLELTRKTSENENLKKVMKQQQQESIALQKRFNIEFQNLANKILEEKSQKFTIQNSENIKNILLPLQEKINYFEKKVEQTHRENSINHATLKEQIIGLKNLNEKMSQEAINLTRALKGDNKTQGNWGELVLERVLEKSGLEKDREYKVQQNFTREDGSRAMPDVVIYLPDGKKIIIDSKVSLTAYERYVNEQDDLAIRNNHLKEHLFSLKKHISELSAKNYQDLYDIDSLDFVLLFVPVETAFSVAVNEESSIYSQAFEKNIVIVTPSTLLATLRTIDSMWNTEKQQRNALEIAKQAGSLYDKFEGLIKDLTQIGKKIDDTKKDYTSAMKKLVTGRGNLVVSVEKLKKMGAKAKKSLPDNLLKKADTQG